VHLRVEPHFGVLAALCSAAQTQDWMLLIAGCGAFSVRQE